MDRLTEKCWKNLDPWECCGQDYHCNRDCFEDGGCAKGCIVPKIYKKLAQYEDLEEQGRLIELLCNVGDKVWTFIPSVFDKTRLEIIDYDIIDCRINKDKSIQYFTIYPWLTFNASDIGKTVFLTSEEAEQALRKVRDKNARP